MYIVEWQGKSASRMDPNWFQHSFRQIAKLTSYAIEERDLTQADRLYSVHRHVIIVINSSFYCCC